jgi:hypothetical protein
MSKRRKTADTSPNFSPGTGPARKKPQTHEKSKSISSSLYLDLGGGNTTAGTAGNAAGNILPLEGTLQDDYAAHEPMAMFPEPSSTVPNATYTQQRLLEEVMNPAFLGIEPEADAPQYQPAKSSVPWSDFLNSPSVRISPC